MKKMLKYFKLISQRESNNEDILEQESVNQCTQSQQSNQHTDVTIIETHTPRR